MKRTFIFFGRGVLALLALLLIATGVMVGSLNGWCAHKISALDGSSKIALTRQGPVEFQSRGEGPAILVLHGAFGGYDQGMIFIPGLTEAGFQIIAPSRPGYLRTPTATGATTEEQADAMAALLDTLGIEQVEVVGISMGGSVALQFALRHPERTKALVLVCAVTEKTTPKFGRWSPLIQSALHSTTLANLGSWYGERVMQHDLRKALDAAFTIWSSSPAKQRAKQIGFVMDDPGQLALFRQVAASTIPLGERLPGIRNDLQQMMKLGNFPFEQIRVPTLLIHGTDDKAVTISTARLAARRIPQATLCELENSSHILMLGPRGSEANLKIIDFLKRHSQIIGL